MNTRNLIIALALLAVAGAGSGYYFYSQASASRNPQQAAQDEAKELVAAVGKLMVLPDELPIIATVADPSKLAGQPFFEKAQKGDKVLIYNSARKAVLYNPETNLIVDVAPLSIGSQPAVTPAP
jgi:hypothetical protein